MVLTISTPCGWLPARGNDGGPRLTLLFWSGMLCTRRDGNHIPSTLTLLQHCKGITEHISNSYISILRLYSSRNDPFDQTWKEGFYTGQAASVGHNRDSGSR